MQAAEGDNGGGEAAQAAATAPETVQSQQAELSSPSPPPTSAPHPSSSLSHSVELHPGVVRRVKVYELDETETWREQGTGQVQLHVRCALDAGPVAVSPSSPSFDDSEAALGSPSPPPCTCCPSLLLLVWPEQVESGGEGVAVSAVSGPSASSPWIPPLLSHRVEADVAYSLQAETILSWTQPSDGRDRALSFQDGHRCHEIVQAIVEHQRETAELHQARLAASLATEEAAGLRSEAAPGEEEGGEDAGLPSHQLDVAFDSTAPSSPLHPLTPPSSSSSLQAAQQLFPLVSSLAVLPFLHQRLLDSQTDSALRHSLLAVTSAPGSAWLSSVYSLCQQLEEAQDVAGLQSLFGLVVAAVNLLHDEQLLERLFDTAHAYHTFNLLEYDTAIVTRLTSTNALTLPLRCHSEALRAMRCHRLLKTPPTSSIEESLHALYRLSYAKEVVLLQHLDDAALSTFTSILYLHKLSIIQQVHEDSLIVHQLTHTLQRHLRRRRLQDDEAGDATAPVSRSDVIRLSSSPTASPVCRCEPRRVLQLEDMEKEDDERVTRDEEQPTSGARRSPSLALFRPHLQFVVELLQLSKTLQPHLRSSFAESFIEHGLIDSVSAALQGEAGMAKRMQTGEAGEEEKEREEGDSAIDRKRRRRLLRGSVRCVRWLFPLCISVLSALLNHCPDSFRSY